ncbi:23672_t:CDS:2 [Entrophospora sp. SA101]|nr:13881_t:CDS:2 [Entrophospora sp. SA101]CAJ0768231.1 17827_t:CDS:2 [Entrophospora sp. SA101]CAJ0768234.1 23672_t:CDS:2 [Entrophospora sp. SA101]CAJ0843391.1 3067_t:CDS:2 [Entrophospora sp. SA101]CAJ0923670.1 4928_t:CDS:2 [Entrophospora sp. SA101]
MPTHANHYITKDFDKFHVESLVLRVQESHRDQVLFRASEDWEKQLSSDITNDLVTSLKVHHEQLVDTGDKIAQLISRVATGTWSPGILPQNVIKDLSINFPIYISDFYDQLAGWSRENAFDQGEEIKRIGSDVSSLAQSRRPYDPALSGFEPELTGKFANTSWVLNQNKLNFGINTSANSPQFIVAGNVSAAPISSVYRYFGFIDQNKRALTMKADGSVVKDLYDLKNHGKYYSLYNKKYKVRLGVYDGNEIRSGKIAQNSWDRSAVLLVEDPLTYNYSIVTLPLVAWKNSSGQFLTLTNDQHGDLSFTNGETTHEGVAPKSEQLFMFVPHPASRLPQTALVSAAPPAGKGSRINIWKADPFVKSIGIRSLYFPGSDITTGPTDSLLITSSTSGPIAPDVNGDFLLNFIEDNSQTPPPSAEQVKFDVMHTFAVVKYTFGLLTGDLEYLDGKPPTLNRPWGNKKLVIQPHSGTNFIPSRGEGVLRFLYEPRPGQTPIYLCRSLDIVAHETGHLFLDTIQQGWLSDGQTGALHEAFGDLCSMFVTLSMPDLVDNLITFTKSNLRDTDNFLSAIGEEFGDYLYKNKGKGLRNLINDEKGSTVESEVFSGFIYDVLVDVFNLERNPAIRSDALTLLQVGETLRRAFLIALRVSSSQATNQKYQEVAVNLQTALATIGRRINADLSGWIASVKRNAIARELTLAGTRDSR